MPVHECWQESSRSVHNADCYEMLSDNLKPAIENKCWALLLKHVLSLSWHWISTHTGIWTVETLQHLHFEVSEHPPCSPDVSPSDLSPLWSSPRSCKRQSVCQWAINGGICACMACHSAKNFFFIRACRNLFTAWQIIVNSMGLNGKWCPYNFALILKNTSWILSDSPVCKGWLENKFVWHIIV